MRRPPLFSIVLWIIAGVLLVGVGGWWLLLRSDAPPRAALPDRPTDVRLPGGEPAGTTSGTPDGEWTVQRGPEVFVGYRVTEQWAAEKFDKQAVGRTGSVTGEMNIRDGRVSAVRLEVDMASLDSGQSARDALLRTKGLETDRYRTARFELVEPVELPAVRSGEAIELDVPGNLTLHGRTSEVLVRLEARWTGGTIDIAGHADVFMPDFDIAAPSTPFISVRETGEIEVQLTFRRA